jgi:lambda family phage portal protein
MDLRKLRQRIARLIAPKSIRLYNGAAQSRLTFGFGSGTTSADGELSSSLTSLRNRSRQLIRDNSYAKRARAIVVNNVLGSGVGIQAQVMTTRDELATAVNNGIESAWRQWSEAKSCHTGGVLAFEDMERLCLEQVFEAGEVFIRKHPLTLGRSSVPMALEIIEAERIAENMAQPWPGAVGQVRQGIEVDGFGRPVAYYIRKHHPGDTRWSALAVDEVIRVPASDIIHIGLRDRWPQTRCVPWMHAVLRKLNDIDGYSEAEITAARAAACYMGFVETDEPGDEAGTGDVAANGQSTIPMEPGIVERLAYGEKMNFVAPNRPNSAVEAFLRYMLREMAAGCGVSYESLSRDYSQSNYSSSRLALLDDRDLWRILQQWWVRSFRAEFHREWLQLAVMARAIPAIPIGAYAADPVRYEAVKWLLRGWGFVDPGKEVAAYKEAVRCGFTTITDVVSQYSDGRDVEEIARIRAVELEMFEDAGINLDTTVEPVQPPTDVAPKPDDEPDEPASDDDRGLRVIRR